MKTLYWRRQAGRGRKVMWLLTNSPNGGFPGFGQVSYCHVASFDNGRQVWAAQVFNHAGCSIANGQFGSTTAAKRFIEREIDKRSIGLFNEDEVEFVR